MATKVADENLKRPRRPGEGKKTKLDQDVIDKSWKYVDEDWRAGGDVIPSIEALSLYIGITRPTLYTWMKENEEYLYIVNTLKDKQAQELLNNGLNGSFNSTITKLILNKHDYTEKSEVHNTITMDNVTDEELNARIVALQNG
jgi:hypothetical protein